MKRTIIAAAAAVLLPIAAQAAVASPAKPAVEERLGPGGRQVLEDIRREEPLLHVRVRRFLRLALLRRPILARIALRLAGDLLEDAGIRQVFVRNVVARFRVARLLREHDEAGAGERARLKEAIRKAAEEEYEAELAARELRIERAQGRLAEFRRDRAERIGDVVGLLED